MMLNNNNISFEITTENELVKIPTMIIQPFVENAIHHGLKGKTKNGKVGIRFYTENQQFICTITDNGIGREKAKELAKNRSHQSKALRIIKERLHYLSEETQQDYRFEFIDLAVGTQVKVYLGKPNS